MPKEHSLNRRDVLKKLGAGGGIALAGMPAVVSAEQHDLSDKHIERVLSDPRVRSVRDAVGGFKVMSAEKKQIEKANLSVTATRIETDVGILAYTELEGYEPQVQLKFADLTEEPQLRQRLPQKYQNAPVESEIILKSDNSVSLVRSVTDEEKQKLAEAVGGSNNILGAVYDSEIDKYRVTTGYVSEDSQNIQEYYVDAKGEGRPTPTQEVEPIFRTQGCINKPCGTCASWAASRGLCYVSCYGGFLPACIGCLALTSGTAFLQLPACKTCADRCL